MKNLVDLHAHTIKSDGTYSPNELLKKAEKEQLKILSITDHETVEAYYDLDRSLFTGKLISGIELRTTCCGVAIELLGYGFNINTMKDALKKFNYKTRAELDYEILILAYRQYKNIGIKFSENFIKNYNPDIHIHVSKYIQADISSFNENKIFLKNFPDGKSFFRLCMSNPASPLFVDFTSLFPKPEEIIDLIKQCGGIVSIPHIFAYKENSEKILYTLLDNYKIDAIECFYSTFTGEQTNFLINICEKCNKYISGGSDFHGDARPSVKLGHGTDDNLNIPINKVNEWINNIQNIEN